MNIFFRYVHRRSPSPKPANKLRLREKSITKSYAPKSDPVEPPPPGFESLPIENLTDETNRHNKKVDSDIPKNDDQSLARKRPRPSNKTVDPKANQYTSRSCTPPAKSKIPKISISNSSEIQEMSSTMPDNSEKNGHHFEKKQEEQILHSESSINIVKSQESVESKENIEKENNIKLDTQYKDRKKKKKVKSERKKSRKDKKEKKDKTKKSYSGSNEPTPDKFLGSNTELNPSDDNLNCHSTNLPQLKTDISGVDTLKKDEYMLNTELSGHELNRDALSSSNDVNDILLSKWELDDNNFNSNLLDQTRKVTCNKNQDHPEITSDVIRKAENAIFAKAINAIRPVEFKVVIDSKRNSRDPSISLKSDHRDRSHSPKSIVNKSVKDRLGNKVVSERNYSCDRSRDSRRENSEKKSRDDKNRNSSLSFRYRSKDKDSKERVVTLDKNYETHRNRRSNERDTINKTEKNANSSEVNKHKSQLKDKSSTKSSRGEKRVYDTDKSDKTGESRFISSIASRPCRPDNPFRKFDEKIVSKISKREVTPPSDHAEYKKRKDKKPKKLKRSSSTESVTSDKRRDSKSKKKSKVLKKKKKSRK